MASLRLLARTRPCDFLRGFAFVDPIPRGPTQVPQFIKRDSSYRSSEIYDETKQYTDFEVTSDPKEWKFVERLLPSNIIPIPKTEVSTLGWKASTAQVQNQTYFVRRSKNHMQPVYLERSFRGMRRITVLKHIEGDIWALNNELKDFLDKSMKFKVICQVNEFAQRIKYKTDCVKYVKEWLDMKGF